ncbi:GNAT family N-acetyltransferase [Halobacillus shinanisalinarum]|uniref:GNAT family N-acetyltransferase n=1 Tax=Halobacillus shinanisalinarum TaxID=2932258 RepID=A0ABY4H4Q3_9BACI|nr:GNAT family N-acetyltransferase [Halobacillus shinanisalinarum]UOQ95442.1 GNAT family N-acetyltransferase [Halobacillus shinanisalinarum]
MKAILEAKPEDASEILHIQKQAYRSEAELYNDYDIQPLQQTVSGVEKDFESSFILKYVLDGKIVGSVRASKENGTCHIGKLMVDPDFQGRGIGKELMREIEGRYEHVRFELFTGNKSIKNIAFYEGLGYKGYKTHQLPREDTVFLFMEKTHSKIK